MKGHDEGLRYLCNPNQNRETINKEVASGDVVPCDTAAIHYQLPSCVALANESNMKVDEELHGIQKPCHHR